MNYIAQKIKSTTLLTSTATLNYRGSKAKGQRDADLFSFGIIWPNELATREAIRRTNTPTELRGAMRQSNPSGPSLRLHQPAI